MKPTALSRYLIEAQHQGHINADLRLLLEVVARACKTISTAVGKGALGGVLGDAGTGNVQGEAQKKLDVLSNEILLEANEWGGHLAGLASEEMEHAHAIPNSYPRGNYLLLFDPLDGSSNIDVNVSVGTIFSVLRCPDGVTEPGDEHFLQPGTEQVCAGYTVYGPSTILVLTYGRGTHMFTLDREQGSFVLTRTDVRVPEDTKEFAINLSNQRFWQPPMQAYIADLLAGKTGPRGKDFNMRWIASMVSEVHRILTRGGIFIYPTDNKDPSKIGRLRLMYEANPMAFIIEQAGGACSTGRGRMLEVAPTSLHQRIPVFLGSRHEVAEAERYHRDYDQVRANVISNGEDFIGVYPGLLDAMRCRAIVEQFDASQMAVPGRVGGGVMPELKLSQDIQLDLHPSWRAVERELNTAMFRALLHYIREYPYAMIAPLLLERQMPDGSKARYSHDDIRALDDKSLGNLLRTVFRPGSINLQRYQADQGGYPYWHCEHYPKDRNAESLHRVLLWTAYLNDGFDAGETEFHYQQRKIIPSTGTFLIAPASFTHTHRGNRPKNSAKYIATSWILFQRAETLYGKA